MDVIVICLLFVIGEGIVRESLTFMGCLPLFLACGYVSAAISAPPSDPIDDPPCSRRRRRRKVLRSSSQEGPMKVLLRIRADVKQYPGGDYVQLLRTRETLEELGFHASSLRGSLPCRRA